MRDKHQLESSFIFFRALGFAGETEFVVVVVANDSQSERRGGVIPSDRVSRLERTQPVRGKPNEGGDRDSTRGNRL